jgi:hypothetical protein
MCEFVSFIVCADGRLLTGNRMLHEGIARAYGLAPGTYREAEWTRDDDGASLVVCLGATEDQCIEREWRQKVLRVYPTRKALRQGLRDGRSVNALDEHVWWRALADDAIGVPHRDDGPAVVYPGGVQAWYRNGLRHRVGAPAVVYPGGVQAWYRNGLRHRVGGPAVERADGSREWWVHGTLIRRRYIPSWPG